MADDTGIVVGTERAVRAQDGVVAEAQMEAEGLAGLLGAIYFESKSWPWLPKVPHMSWSVTKWWPKAGPNGLAFDELPRPDDDRGWTEGRTRGEVAAGLADARRREFAARGIAYVVKFYGQEVDLSAAAMEAIAEVVALEAASARAEPEPEGPDDGIRLSPLSSDEDIVIGGLKKSGDRGSA